MSGEPALEPLALTVGRLCLPPADDAGGGGASGAGGGGGARLRHQSRVGIAIRAGLFVELIAEGRLTGARWPQAVGYALGAAPLESAGLADSLQRAVAGRPQVRWRRWYSHVETDLVAARTALVESGAWSLAEAGDAGATAGVRASLRAPILDLDPALTQRQADQARDVLLTAQSKRPASGSASAEELALVLLSVGAGLQGRRPRPRAALSVLDQLLPPDEASRRWQSALLPEPGRRGGDRSLPSERTVLRAALRAALEAMRARAGSRLLSG
ncbi:MAG: hypothetical protein JWO63_459 [Frankiales bacterium]|nr:hypothetical protein [Frankiales bacterium]